MESQMLLWFGTCRFDSKHVPGPCLESLKDLPAMSRSVFPLHSGGVLRHRDIAHGFPMLRKAPKYIRKVFLLLLFITPPGLGKDCLWKHNPLLTTDQSYNIKKLKGWMLFDYPVSVPTNLKQNEFCQKLWDLHFIHRELVHMAKVSGENLTAEIERLTNITNFVADCKIKENDCIRFERRNVSQFLDSIPSIFTALKQHMDRFEDEDIDFSNCTILQCQLDIKDAEQKSLSFTSPKTKQAEWTTKKSLIFTTPGSKQAEQDSQSSQAATSRKHYWWLMLLLIGLLLLVLVVGTRLKRRRQSLNLPLEPPEQL